MENALPRSGAAVDHYAEPIFGNSLVFSQLISDRKNIADKALVFLLQIEKSDYVLPRDDQEMDGRLRVNILEGYNGIVLIDNAPFDVAFNDAAK